MHSAAVTFAVVRQAAHCSPLVQTTVIACSRLQNLHGLSDTHTKLDKKTLCYCRKKPYIQVVVWQAMYGYLLVQTVIVVVNLISH